MVGKQEITALIIRVKNYSKRTREQDKIRRIET